MVNRKTKTKSNQISNEWKIRQPKQTMLNQGMCVCCVLLLSVVLCLLLLFNTRDDDDDAKKRE